MKLRFVLIAASILTANMAQAADAFRAWLDVNRQGESLTVVPYATADKAAEIRYRFTARKRGTSGTSENRQAGRAALIPGMETPLSRLHLRIAANDRYTLEVEVFFEGMRVARDSLSIPGDASP